MSETENTAVQTKRSDFSITLKKASAITLAISVGAILVIAAFACIIILYDAYDQEFKALIKETPRNEAVVYVVSWLILAIISALASLQIREIIRQSKDMFVKRANYIAMIIALVLIVFLFKQPYLNRLFGKGDTELWIKSVLFTAGAGTGWVVWYLRQLKRYGEFFNIFLFTSVTGLCWYARLTAPEDVQLTAVAFLLASLFRVAKDYLDQAYESKA